jgi:hypothetical protein
MLTILSFASQLILDNSFAVGLFIEYRFVARGDISFSRVTRGSSLVTVEPPAT